MNALDADESLYETMEMLGDYIKCPRCKANVYREELGLSTGPFVIDMYELVHVDRTVDADGRVRRKVYKWKRHSCTFVNCSKCNKTTKCPPLLQEDMAKAGRICMRRCFSHRLEKVAGRKSRRDSRRRFA